MKAIVEQLTPAEYQWFNVKNSCKKYLSDILDMKNKRSHHHWKCVYPVPLCISFQKEVYQDVKAKQVDILNEHQQTPYRNVFLFYPFPATN